MKKTTFFAALLSTASVFAQTGEGMSGSSMAAIAAAIAIGAAALGGTLAQGKASSVALEGIARNPGAQNKIFTPLIISLALVESLVVLTWLISYFLVDKV